MLLTLIHLPESNERPYHTNEAGVRVGVADKLPPHHDQNETSHHTRRRHVLSAAGRLAGSANFRVELRRGTRPQLVQSIQPLFFSLFILLFLHLFSAVHRKLELFPTKFRLQTTFNLEPKQSH